MVQELCYDLWILPAQRLIAMKTYRGIGLMSGTSLDGIDLAYCEFQEQEGTWTFDLLATESIPMDEQWYARLRCLDTVDARTFARTDVYFAHYLGQVLTTFIDKYEVRPQFVASHGQTIFHEPQRNYTTQIGDGETLVSYLACPPVCNFRNKDVALGGQGAPLVPFGERPLWPDHRLFLNLGGFANLSNHLPNGKVIAFDVAPANLALNWLCQNLEPSLPFDPQGQIASQGQINPQLFESLQRIPFYQKAPPKSLGTEWFEAQILPLLSSAQLSIPDRLRTYVEHLVSQITQALQVCNASQEPLLVTGGGALNSFLMDRLTESLAIANIQLSPAKREIIEFKEAIVFGFLGLHTLLGHPNILSSVTGSNRNVLGGSIHLPAAGGWNLL